MSKIQMFETLALRIWSLFRISDLGFRILIAWACKDNSGRIDVGDYTMLTIAVSCGLRQHIFYATLASICCDLRRNQGYLARLGWRDIFWIRSSAGYPPTPHSGSEAGPPAGRP